MATFTQAQPNGTPAWVDLTSPDAEAARAFYQAVFGWEYDVGGPEFGGYTTARMGQHATAGIVGNQPGAPPEPPAWGLYFAADDIEAGVARATELGASVRYPAMAVGTFGSMATLEDPTGAAFSLWQAGQHIGWQMSDEPGATTWYELYSPDAKRARDFYCALLGASADPMPGGMEYYVLKHGERMLGGIMQIDPSWGAFPAQWGTYFAVADADATAGTIVQHGGKLMSAVEDTPFGRMAAVADPAGALFKIIQLPPR